MHLGLGAFSRAHQTVYTQEVLAEDPSWGVVGVSQRSADVVRQLRPQDGVYSVLVRAPTGPALQVVTAVRDVLYAGDESDRLLDLLASPQTRVVTLTVTEKGYRHDPATGRLRVDDPDLAADLSGRAPVTVVGQLARGLQRRRTGSGAPVSLLSCDNLAGNGEVLRAVLLEFCARIDDGLAAWVADSVSFPSSMVDRITPSTTAADRSAAAALLGVADEGVVVTEPFRQWVVQDAFVAGRPAWGRAGALLTDDVAPYEAIKLRLLNGSHSALAYLGALAGHEHVADAVAQPAIAAAVTALMAEVAPTLRVPDGFDLEAYRKDLVVRWQDPQIRHRLLQIATDGSQKLPQRLLAPARELLAAGQEPRLVCLALAAWMRFVSAGVDDAGRPLPLDDPLADRLRAATAGCATPTAVVDALLGRTDVFGEELPTDDRFRALLTGALTTLTRAGAVAAARDAVRQEAP